MATSRKSQILLIITVLITICSFSFPVYAKYSGGTGEPDDPYQIATAGDLFLLGESPEDYDKHFLLTADIDLDPNLPGRKVFDKAVIAPDVNDIESGFQGTSFSGVFDGSGHTISHLTITGESYLGLFGQLASEAEIRDIGVVDVNITGSGRNVSGLVGYNDGGTVTQCYSTGTVSGTGQWSSFVGGLVGSNWDGTIATSYNTGAVSGNEYVGGLVGDNYGSGIVLHSVWDTQTSGLSGSACGVGLTTAEMMDSYMLGLNGFANDPNWVLDAGRDYPRLAWEGTPGGIIPEPVIDWLEGQGTPEDPYRIDTADQLTFLGRASALCDRHFVLSSDIDLYPNLPNGQVFPRSVIPNFTGVFDGSGHCIRNLTITGGSLLGLFGELSGEVRDLGVVDVNIIGSRSYVGGLVGGNDGNVTNCYSTGAVSGSGSVGGLVGYNSGDVTKCYSTGSVSCSSCVGGLVGENGEEGAVTNCYSAGAVSGNWSVGGLVGENWGTLTQCYSTGAVSGNWSVGGLVGGNGGAVTQCYSTGAVSGNWSVGGLVGLNYDSAVTQCYSTGAVSGNNHVGGLLGAASYGTVVTTCFWDTQTSGQASSAGGTGKTTAEMQTASTFLDAGWDFID
ncbi:MAG: GLUG motif-containing protein, partial [Sedimentisphaerales bacterium]